MRNHLKIALRVAGVIAVLGLIPVAFAPAPADSPYVSAMERIAGAPVANQVCHSVCNKAGTGCVTVTRLKNCKLGNPCVNTDC